MRGLNRFTDWTVCLLVFFFMAAIPKFGIFFLAPKYLMIGLAFFLIVRRRAEIFGGAWRCFPKTLLFFYLLVAAESATRSSPGGAIRLIEGLSVYLILYAFVCGDKERRIRTIRLVSIVLTVSALWLIGSTLVGGPFISLRQCMYKSTFERYEWGYRESLYPSGLVQAHFNTGYQLSAGMILTIFLFFIEKGRWRLLWFGSFCAMTAAVFLSAQRSIIPAVVFSGGYYLLKKRKMKYLLIAAALGALVAMMYLYFRDVALQTHTLSDKIERSQDLWARIGWQIASVKVILENPLGNLTGQLNWGEEAVRHGADFSLYSWNEMYVHNSYLGFMMVYGWPGVVLILGAIAHVIKKIINPSLSGETADTFSKGQAETVSVALIAVMIQAMLHNSSLFSLDPTTWVVFSLASVQAQEIRYQRRKMRMGLTESPAESGASF